MRTPPVFRQYSTAKEASHHRLSPTSLSWRVAYELRRVEVAFGADVGHLYPITYLPAYNTLVSGNTAFIFDVAFCMVSVVAVRRFPTAKYACHSDRPRLRITDKRHVAWRAALIAPQHVLNTPYAALDAQPPVSAPLMLRNAFVVRVPLVRRDCSITDETSIHVSHDTPWFRIADKRHVARDTAFTAPHAMTRAPYAALDAQSAGSLAKSVDGLFL